MYLVPFVRVSPELAAKETRTVTLFEPRDGVPAGQYGIIEAYCPDPDCDCQRVMLNVVEEKHLSRYLASISYGFDREAEDAGPFLDPLNAQCSYAGGLLRLVAGVVLTDTAYLARLQRHYDVVKQAASDPQHPAYDRLQEACERDKALATAPPVRRARPRRNDPCPCGSGKKYKHCCMRQERS